jgi:hypothetical protein
MKIVKGNLYKSKDNGLVVMAEAQQNEDCFSGQVVGGDESYKKGKFSTAWNKDVFQPYSAEIIIKEVIDFSKVQFVELNDGDVVLANGIHEEDTFAGVLVSNGRFSSVWSKDFAKRVVTAKFQ